MTDELATPPSNPSSVHYFGQEARKRLTKARQTIADFLGVRSSEILFSSGGTESLNMLLRGYLATNPQSHILTSDIEHSSVYETVKSLEKRGAKATFVPAGIKGFVTPTQVEEAILPTTRLIVLSAANSETGVKIDLEAIAEIASRHNIPFLVDGVALLGKQLFSLPAGVSAMAFSAHKFHGPKGIGFAYVDRKFKWEPQQTGGQQEQAMRAGTENLAGIVGLAKSVEILAEELPMKAAHMQALRDHFEQSLQKQIENLVIHGVSAPRLVNTSNISFPGVEAETLLMQLDLAGLAASHGSACSSGALEPSRILLSMGVPKAVARSSLRFSLSRLTTPDEIEQAISTILRLIK